MSLAEVRMRAIECRRLLLDGIDPIEHRLTQREARTARGKTFATCAEAYIEAHHASGHDHGCWTRGFLHQHR